MFTKKILPAAIASACLLTAAGTVNAGDSDCRLCTGEMINMYATESLAFLDFKNGSAPPRFYDGDITSLDLEGIFGWGWPAGAGDILQMRFDLTNARWGADLDSGDLDVLIGGFVPNDVELAQWGTQGDTKVIFAVNPLSKDISIDDRFELDMDSNENNGLITSVGVDATVRYCMYDEADDAKVGDEARALYCNTAIIAQQKPGFEIHRELAAYDPIADVKCKGRKGDGGGSNGYHDRPPSYSCFVHRGERNFGAVEIITRFAGYDGDESNADDFMYLTGQNAAYWEFRGPMAWVNQGPDKGIQRVRQTRSGSTGCDGATFYDLSRFGFPYNRARINVNTLQPFDGNSPIGEPGDGNWTLCMDDADGGNHPLIPIVDNYFAQLIMPASPTTASEVDLNGIDRNGILLRAPLVTDMEGADQRVILVNRGDQPAEYRFEFTTEVKEGISFVRGPLAQGVLNPGETCSLPLQEVVDFQGPYPRGSAIIIVAGKSTEIDGAVLLVSGGTAVTTNMTPDEGYNSKLGIIPMVDDDEED